MDLTELTETRPGVRSGKPCFVGTHIAVYDVLDYLASGMTAEEIVDSDFRQLAFLHGPPPKAIWVRLGNASTIETYEALRNNHDEIVRFGADVDEAVLVLP